ncbi:putative Tetratricopeptide repeat-like superfamily protein [Hibiscus syriacus]|uniref:Tetratricopeptide repeat-like superfamily protein n=1 Tax=Hibiscus syriacus TaxID=106335 RepID=A0A6A3B860_HIBSY|nr:putative Tetratricopeptide repeat-like superfamily protein [Hibiscus syriacus]
MPSKSSELHFVLIPLFFPGHQIPMVDMGRLLAQRSVTVTIVTTPLNAIRNFMEAIGMLQQPIEQFVVEMKLKPNCIISDRNLPWTFDMAQKFDIPRLAFDGTSCFTVVCSHFITLSKIHETVSNNRQPFVVPVLEGISAGLPMITWPLAEQFFNKKLVVSVLRIGGKGGFRDWDEMRRGREVWGNGEERTNCGGH